MEVTTKQILMINKDQEFAANLKLYFKEFDLGVIQLNKVKEVSILKNKYAGKVILCLYVVNSEYESYISDLSYIKTFDKNIKIIAMIPKYFSSQAVDEILDLGIEEILVSPLASLKLLYNKIEFFNQVHASVNAQSAVASKLSTLEGQIKSQAKELDGASSLVAKISASRKLPPRVKFSDLVVESYCNTNQHGINNVFNNAFNLDQSSKLCYQVESSDHSFIGQSLVDLVNDKINRYVYKYIMATKKLNFSISKLVDEIITALSIPDIPELSMFLAVITGSKMTYISAGKLVPVVATRGKESIFLPGSNACLTKQTSEHSLDLSELPLITSFSNEIYKLLPANEPDEKLITIKQFASLAKGRTEDLAACIETSNAKHALTSYGILTLQQ